MSPPASSRAWTHPLSIVRLAIWFGIATAWTELGILGFRKYIARRPSFGMPDRVSLLADYRDVFTVPIAESITLLGALLLLAVIAFTRPGRRLWLVASGLAMALSVISVLLNFSALHPLAVIVLGAGAGVRFAGAVGARGERFERLVQRTLMPMIALVAASGGGVSLWHALQERGALAQADAEPGAPNVLLIILDTVRSFSLSAYGYDRPTSPHLSQLAEKGVRFERAYATAPWTLPSHASIFTGRLPHELSGDLQSALDVSWPTVAEQMRARGYATAGFVGNLVYTSAETGLARGFAHYEDHVLTRGSIINCSSILRVAATVPALGKVLGRAGGEEHKDADRINRDFLRWLPATGKRPYFAFLNYYDAHRPYSAPPKFASKYLASRAPLRDILQGKQAKARMTPEAAAIVRNAYDGALTFLDDRIGRLMDELEQRGALENTVVLITSDHGEQFGEHGLFFHANSLYTQLLRVPLVIFGTRRVPQGVTVPSPVSLRELASTIIDLSGGDGPTPFPGRSLSRYWSTDAADTIPPAVVMAELGRSAERIQDFAAPVEGIEALIADGQEYIRNGRNRVTGAGPHEELYDLERDSLNTVDLAGSPAREAPLRHLRARFDSLVSAKPLQALGQPLDGPAVTPPAAAPKRARVAGILSPPRTTHRPRSTGGRRRRDP